MANFAFAVLMTAVVVAATPAPTRARLTYMPHHGDARSYGRSEHVDGGRLSKDPHGGAWLRTPLFGPPAASVFTSTPAAAPTTTARPTTPPTPPAASAGAVGSRRSFASDLRGDEESDSVDAGHEEPEDRLTAIYNYIRQLVRQITGGGEPEHGQMYKRIKNHVNAVHDSSDPFLDAAAVGSDGEADDDAAATAAADEEDELDLDAVESKRMCGAHVRWVLVNRTVDTFGDPVEVVHDIYRQWYQYTECVHPQRACNAVDDSLYESSCTQTEAFQLMYARSLKESADGQPSFKFVLVPRDCICAATPRKNALSRKLA